MSGEYYTLPIPFKRLVGLKDIPKCDLQTSIAQKIHLTLTTFFEESRYNRRFGCLIWEYDFETIYNVNSWKDKVVKSVGDTLKENEKRLNNIQISIEINQEETGKGKALDIKTIRKRLDVRVTGNLQKTNEFFVFAEPVYVSPISLD